MLPKYPIKPISLVRGMPTATRDKIVKLARKDAGEPRDANHVRYVLVTYKSGTYQCGFHAKLLRRPRCVRWGRCVILEAEKPPVKTRSLGEIALARSAAKRDVALNQAWESAKLARG